MAYVGIPKNFNGYVFEKMDSNSAPATGKVKEETQHVIYVYREHIPSFPLTPASKNITATKIWMYAPEDKPQIYFKLYRKLDGEETEVADVAIKEVRSNDHKLIEKKDNQEVVKVVFENLPVTDNRGKIYTYSVKEVDKDGKPLELKDYIKKEEGLTVTNTYVKLTSGYDDI